MYYNICNIYHLVLEQEQGLWVEQLLHLPLVLVVQHYSNHQGCWGEEDDQHLSQLKTKVQDSSDNYNITNNLYTYMYVVLYKHRESDFLHTQILYLLD